MTDPNVTVVDRDLGVQVINESGVDVEHGAVWQALVGQHPEVAALVRWSAGTQGHDGRSPGRGGTMFERDRYTTPSSIFEQFAVARDAAESDDVVSGVLETTESLAFTRMSFLSEDEDEEDIWNQIGGDLNLDSRLREMWRELFIYCVDEETEALTRRGWLTHDLLTTDDEVLALDPQTNAIIWQPVQAVNRFSMVGTLRRWQTGRFDAVTTNNHRWLTEDRAGRRRFRTTAEIEASPNETLVLAGGEPLAFASQPSFADELVELVGWVVTEGHYRYAGNRALHGFLLNQSRTANPDHVERLRRLAKYFADSGATVSEYGEGANGVVNFFFGAGIAEVVQTIAPYRQLHPEFLGALTRQQAELLFETLLDGDGLRRRYERGTTNRWAQKDQERISGFQMLAAMLGKRTRVSQHDGEACHQVSVYRTGLAHRRSFKSTEVPYSGVVWCPTTPTGTWMARRSGVTYWTGNSQFYACVWFGQKSYKVRGKTGKGNQKRREFKNLRVPLGISLLDPTKVVPVGTLLFNQEQLAYVADRSEIDMLDAAALGEPGADEVARQIITGRYEPSFLERRQLERDGIEVIKLYTLNPVNVWRHTATRSQYQRYATVRMKSVFELLDLKQQLRQMDRAHLIGGTNFIILVTKGTDTMPAKPAEITNLQAQVRTVARVPVIVGDHRLKIEIITPKTDQTLQPDRYNGLDARITARLYQMFMCADDQTQALTAEGWKSHVDVAVGDLLLTLNTDTGLTEWHPASAVNRFEVTDHPMLRMESNAHSSLTTLNHRWWVSQMKGDRKRVWEWRTSDQLGHLTAIPTCAPHGEFPVEAKYGDALVELVGWFVTEGTVRGGRAMISQSEKVNATNCARLRRILTDLFGAESKVGDGGLWYQYVTPGEGRYGGTSTFTLCSEAARELLELAPRKNPPFAFLLALTESQLRLFIDTCVAGDGHIGDRTAFFQDRVDGAHRLRLFEFACALAGIATSTVRHNDTIDRVTLLRNTTTLPFSAAWQCRNSGGGERREAIAEVETHTGTIWCPTVQNSTFLARRNGTVYWTGNTGNFAAGAKGDDSIKLAKVVARGMESRRHMLRRTIEKHIVKPIYDANEDLTTPSKLRFHPSRIDLSFDAALVQFLIDVRDRGDMSRETYLNEVDIDQADEALLRTREKDRYDKVFTPTNVPFGPAVPGAPAAGAPKPAAQDPRTAGRTKGGTKNGGGAAPGSGQGKAPRSGTPKDKPKPTRAADELDTELDIDIEEDEWT